MRKHHVDTFQIPFYSYRFNRLIVCIDQNYNCCSDEMRSYSRATARELESEERQEPEGRPDGAVSRRGSAWEDFGRRHYPQESQDKTFWSSMKPSTVAHEREWNYPHTYRPRLVAQASQGVPAVVSNSSPRQTRRDDPEGFELAKMIYEGKLGGSNPREWTPTHLDMDQGREGRHEDDSGFRRRVQRPYRELIADSKWLREPIDPTESYLANKCKRCARHSIEPHNDRSCNDPSYTLGAFCAYCSATFVLRIDFGTHSKSCWGDPYRNKQRISPMACVFRELEEIKPRLCGFPGCPFSSHIFAIQNTHRIFHEFLASFGIGKPSIFMGELSQWVYDKSTDTYRPPLGILRLLGSAFRWLQRCKPHLQLEYAFYYSFAKDRFHQVQRYQPPPQNLPTVNDIDLFLTDHSWDTAIHLTIDQLNELHRAVARHRREPLAQICGPRRATATAEVHKRRKAAASSHSDVDERAGPPAKRGLTTSQAEIYRHSATQAVAQAIACSPPSQASVRNSEWANEQFSTLADEDSELAQLDRAIGLVSPHEERPEASELYENMFMNFSQTFGGMDYQTTAASGSHDFYCAALFASEVTTSSSTRTVAATHTVTATATAVSSTIVKSPSDAATAASTAATATESKIASTATTKAQATIVKAQTATTTAQNTTTTLVSSENPYMADPARHQPILFPHAPKKVAQTSPRKEVAIATIPPTIKYIDAGASPLLGDILDVMCETSQDEFDPVKTLAQAASRASEREGTVATAVCEAEELQTIEVNASVSDVTIRDQVISPTSSARSSRHSSVERGSKIKCKTRATQTGSGTLCCKVNGEEYQSMIYPQYPQQTPVMWAFHMTSFSRVKVPAKLVKYYNSIPPTLFPQLVGPMVYLNRFVTRQMALYLMPKSPDNAFVAGKVHVYTELSTEPLKAFVAREGEIAPIVYHGQSIRIHFQTINRPLEAGCTMFICTKKGIAEKLFEQNTFLLRHGEHDAAIMRPCF